MRNKTGTVDFYSKGFGKGEYPFELYQKRFGNNKGKFGFRDTKTGKQYGGFYDDIQAPTYTNVVFNGFDKDYTFAVEIGGKWSILSLKDFKCYGEYDAILPTTTTSPFQEGWACVKIAGAWYFLKESDFKKGKLTLRSPFKDGGCDRVDRGFDHGKTLVWKNGNSHYITESSLDLETEREEFFEQIKELAEKVTEGMSEKEADIVKSAMCVCACNAAGSSIGHDFSYLQPKYDGEYNENF